MLRFKNPRGVQYDALTHPDEIHLKANGRLTLGRRRDNDVCLDSLKPQLISRLHASIEGTERPNGASSTIAANASVAGQPSYMLTSIGLNGVSVNGNKVTSPVLLRAGDEIVFGNDKKISELVYEFVLAAEERPASPANIDLELPAVDFLTRRAISTTPTLPSVSMVTTVVLDAPAAASTAGVVSSSHSSLSSRGPLQMPMLVEMSPPPCPPLTLAEPQSDRGVTHATNTVNGRSLFAELKPSSASSTVCSGRASLQSNRSDTPADDVIILATSDSPVSVTVGDDDPPPLLERSQSIGLFSGVRFNSTPPSVSTVASSTSGLASVATSSAALQASTIDLTTSPGDRKFQVLSAVSSAMYCASMIPRTSSAASGAGTAVSTAPAVGITRTTSIVVDLTAPEGESLSPLHIPRPAAKRPHESNEEDTSLAQRAKTGSTQSSAASMSSAAISTGGGVVYGTGGVSAATASAQPSLPSWLDDINEEFLCCICRELMIHATALPCSHTFCRSCLAAWLKKNKTCPSCRARTTSVAAGVRVKALDNAIDHLALQVLPEDERKERQDKIKKLAEAEKSVKASAVVQPRRAQQAGIHVVDVDEVEGNLELRLIDMGNPDFLDSSDSDEDEDEDEDMFGGGFNPFASLYYFERSPSGRAKCHICRNTINLGELRWRWHHYIGRYSRNDFCHFHCVDPRDDELAPMNHTLREVFYTLNPGQQQNVQRLYGAHRFQA